MPDGRRGKGTRRAGGCRAALGDLEDFSARLLAVDPTDVARVNDLHHTLEQMLSSLEKGSPAAELLRLGLRALDVAGQQPEETGQMLDTVAAATAAAVQDLTCRSEQSLAAIRTAASALRKRLNRRKIFSFLSLAGHGPQARFRFKFHGLSSYRIVLVLVLGF